MNRIATAATRALASLAAALLLASPALAEYPDRPVKIISPYAAGGSGDLMQRLIAQKLAERTGKSFVVENKTGAAGRIGYDFAAKSRPDGYTLVGSDPGYAVLPVLYGKLPWDHANDFVPVTIYARTPHALVVAPQSRFKTLGELLQFARANPGQLTFGSSGPGTTGHIAVLQMMADAKVNLTHVPFKGGSEVLNALLSNSVDLMVTGAPTVMGHLKTGTVRVLAMTSEKRWPGAENVPTLIEQGVNVTNYLWFGMFAPRGTPQEAIDYLHRNIVAVLDDPKVKETLQAQAALPVGSAPGEVAGVLRDVTTSWGRVLRAANVKID